MMGLRVLFFAVFVAAASSAAAAHSSVDSWKRSVRRDDGSAGGEASVKVVPPTLEQRRCGCTEPIVYFHNFPKNEKAQIFSKRVLQIGEKEYVGFQTVLIDDNDNLYVDGQRAETYCLSAQGFFLGEKAHLQFRREDDSVIAETAFTPRPLRVRSERGSFSLEMVLESAAPTLYSMRLSGIGDDETIQVTSTSGRESLSYDLPFDPAAEQKYMPGILGRDGGYATLQISRRSGDKVKAEIPWGVSLFDVMKVVDGWNTGT